MDNLPYFLVLDGERHQELSVLPDKTSKIPHFHCYGSLSLDGIIDYVHGSVLSTWMGGLVVVGVPIL